MPDLSPVQALGPEHNVQSFRCRKKPLQRWLRRYALANQQAGSSRTYVVHRGGAVVGYYSLTPAEVRHEDCPVQVAEGMPQNYAIPVILLARLAVDDRERGTGLGKALLKDALARILSAVDIIGGRAVLVHALDEEARAFYMHFGFEETPAGPLQLMLLIEDARAAFDAARAR